MKKIEFLTKEEYINHVEGLDDGHWTKNTISNRWDYHYRAVEIIKATGLSDVNKVLEMGTMGVSCVKGSDTIDFDESWDFKGKKPTYNHDARIKPWPIEDNAYEIFVALRVFQHLVPSQLEALNEAFRIAKKVIVVVPETYNNPLIPNSKGITYDNFVSFLNGIHPNIYLPTAFGNLYYWDAEHPSYFSLKSVMKNIILFESGYSNEKFDTFNKSKAKSFFKKVLKKVSK